MKNPKLETRFTKEKIENLDANEVFVFGSNLNGNHAGGAAKIALDKFGAEQGKSIGLQGQSYAIPTLDKQMQKLPLSEISKSIDDLYEFANNNKRFVFWVTKIGCGIAGFQIDEISKLFKEKVDNKPFNVFLPKEFSIIKGFKGYDENLTCRDFQYEENKTFTHEGNVEACKSGFHFCENPFDVFRFYKGMDKEFTEVEGFGDVDTDNHNSKFAVSNLRVKAKLKLPSFLKLGIEFTRKKVDFLRERAFENIERNNSGRNFSVNSGLDSSVNSGRDSSVNSGLDDSVNSGLDSSVNSGRDSSVNSGLDDSVNSGRNFSVNSGLDVSVNSGLDDSVNSGLDVSVNSGLDDSVNSGRNFSVNSGLDSSVNSGLDSSVNSGLDYSVNSGRNSSVCVGRHYSEINLNGKKSFGIAGKDSKIKGKKGCAICLVEYDNDYNIIGVNSAIVDGEKIKEDTYYKIENGEFIEAEHNN